MRNDWLSKSALLALLLAAGGIQAQIGFLNKTEKVVDGTDVPASIVQWGYRIQGYSSQDGYNAYSAKQALGEPDKWPACGDAGTAWAPGDKPPGQEGIYIRVAFKTAMPIRQVMVAETNRAGCVEAIYLIDRNRKEHEVFRQEALSPEAEDSLAQLPGRMLRVSFKETRYKVYAAKIVLRQREGWNRDQIDAIGISTGTEAWQPAIAITERFAFPGAVTPLDNTVNSAYTEVLPRLSPDGERLYFCRKNHPGNYGMHTNDDIWYADLQEDGNWGPAQAIGWPLNDENHNYVCSVGDDGLLTLGNGYTFDRKPKAGVSQSFQSGGKWVEPLNLIVEGLSILNLNAEYYLSRNRKTLILAMESWDSEGGKDLYVSFSDDELHYSRPVSMGFAINSGGQEMAPFLSDDGRHLFFSSDGFPGYGGQDVFVAERLDDSWTRWSAPENLGPSVNSPAWDAYFYYHAGTDKAYLASNRGNVANEDLYTIQMTPQRDEKREQQRLAMQEEARKAHMSDIGWSAEDVIEARRAQAREQGDAWALAQAEASGTASDGHAVYDDAGYASASMAEDQGQERRANQGQAVNRTPNAAPSGTGGRQRTNGASLEQGSTPEDQGLAEGPQGESSTHLRGSSDLQNPAFEESQADGASRNGPGAQVQYAGAAQQPPGAEPEQGAAGHGRLQQDGGPDGRMVREASDMGLAQKPQDPGGLYQGAMDPSQKALAQAPDQAALDPSGTEMAAHGLDANNPSLGAMGSTPAASNSRDPMPGERQNTGNQQDQGASPSPAGQALPASPEARLAAARYSDQVPEGFVDPRFAGGELPSSLRGPGGNPWSGTAQDGTQATADQAGAFAWESMPPRPQTKAELEAAMLGLPLAELGWRDSVALANSTDASALGLNGRTETSSSEEDGSADRGGALAQSVRQSERQSGGQSDRNTNQLILYGGVYNAVDGDDVASRIAFYDPTFGRIDMHTDSNRAFYTVGVRRGQAQEVVVQADGFFSERFRFTPRDPDGKGKVREDFELIPIREGQTISLENIYFDVNSATLQSESFESLDRWAEILSNHPGVVVQVQGHTNNLCSPRFCQELSQKRARAVSQYLAERGVAPGSLRFRGFGSKDPVADNNSTKGRAKNQRVELKILKAH